MPADDEVLERLRALGLRTPADTLRALLEHATKSRLSPTQVCEQLVAVEERERAARNLNRRTKLATLGAFHPLDRFDWNYPRRIDRALYERLLTLEFVEQGHNVLLRGPSGVGKTTLAQNLGLAALKEGYSVRFTTLAGALADLLKQESLPALDRRLRRYATPDLLVVDELGYLPCDGRSADLLYHVISRRHLAKSTVITTNLAFKQWGTVFPGAACVAALVDRFVQNCHILDIDGDSGRSRQPSEPAAAAESRRPRRRR
jgi:DNA replication protein DnaC